MTPEAERGGAAGAGSDRLGSRRGDHAAPARGRRAPSAERSDRPGAGDRRGAANRREAGDRRRETGDLRDDAAGPATSTPAVRGPRAVPRRQGEPEPVVDEGVTGGELDRSVRAELRTLSKENAQGVAAHLVMVGALLGVDPQAALAHADAAVRRAGRVAAVREARGMVAYRVGDFARALAEFRTARRLSGSSTLLPLIVDCERALGRPGRALGLAAGAEAGSLGPEEQAELAIVVSGIRRDAGQLEAAAAGLEVPHLHSGARSPWAARLRYAYAEAQLALGNTQAARQWFARAAEADEELTTDAAERLEELDGVSYTDLLGEGDAEKAPGPP